MRKDELLYLHHLLALLRKEFERRDAAGPETFSCYEDVDVSPMAIYASKSDHRRAVQALATDLATAAAGEPERVLHST